MFGIYSGARGGLVIYNGGFEYDGEFSSFEKWKGIGVRVRERENDRGW